MNRKQHLTWVTLDLRPIEEGWRALFLGPEQGRVRAKPVVAWLVQAEEAFWDDGIEEVEGQPPLTQRRRRVVAALADNTTGEAYPVDKTADFWCIVAPRDFTPSDEAAASEHEKRRKKAP